MPQTSKKAHHHCCDQMALKADFVCPQHPDPLHCRHTQIYYEAKIDEYGMPYYDGSEEYSQIWFCPWCGSKLPTSRREEWFERLRVLGINPWIDPMRIPAEFNTDEWYRGKRTTAKTSRSAKSPRLRVL